MKAHVREKHPEKIVKPCDDDLHYVSIFQIKKKNSLSLQSLFIVHLSSQVRYILYINVLSLQECSLCFRKFKHKKNLIAHVRQKHKNHNESSIVGMITLFGSVSTS